MADNKVTIGIDVVGNAQIVLNGVTKALDDLGTKGQNSLNKVAGAFSVFAGSLAANAVTGVFNSIKSSVEGFAHSLISEGVKAAIEQEDAINKLNQALNASGKYTDAASKELQEYASALQKTTKFADETIIEAEGLIQSLGRLDKEGLKKATAAAADLSAALGIDLHSAALLVGKAASGEVGTFGRYGVSIQKGATDAITFARALDGINSRFGGAAASQVNTYSGSVAVLKNQFNDALEQIGNAIIKNTALIAVFKEAGRIVGDFEKFLGSNQTVLREFVTSAVLFAVDSLGNFLKAVDLAGQGVNKLLLTTAAAQVGLAKFNNAITLGSNIGGYADALTYYTEAFIELEKKIKDSENSVSTLDQLRAAVQGLSDAASNSQNGAAVGAAIIIDGFRKAAVAAQELTDKEIELGKQGEALAKQGVNKSDPQAELNSRIDALNAALDQEKISLADRNVAYAQFDQERITKSEEENAKLIDNYLAANELLTTENLFKNQEQVRDNKEAIDEILRDEEVSTKQKLKVEQAYANSSKAIEAARIKAGTDSLNALATLQSAKTKEIAAVGKAAAIAQTTIDTYRGAQAAAAALAGIPLVGPVLAATAAAAFIAAGLFRVAQISGVELASGLTEVPAGYGNDTFPARLSTGERVVDSETNKDLKLFLQGSAGMATILQSILGRLNSLEFRTTVNIGNKAVVDQVRLGIESGRTIDV